MLLINAVNAAGRPVELFVKDGKIAAVGQDLSALAGEGGDWYTSRTNLTSGNQGGLLGLQW